MSSFVRAQVYCREEIFLPLGMPDCYVGMPQAAYDGYAADGRFAELRTMGAKGKILTTATVGVKANEVMACVPGSNGRAPACQWLRVFECLLAGGTARDGTVILKPETVEMFTRRHRVGMFDAVQGILCDWSLGLFVRTGDAAQQMYALPPPPARPLITLCAEEHTKQLVAVAPDARYARC